MIYFLKSIYLFIRSIISNSTYTTKDKKTIPIKSLDKLETYEIIVYLPTPPSSYYQLEQWLKPLKELEKKASIAVITRSTFTFSNISQLIELPIIHIERMNTLRDYYRDHSPKITLYVNNSLKNNQSLLNRNSYHIHINHGESEKESMSSNQSKAYDYVFTVGQRGIDRYRENLLNFNPDKYIKIGRPQLDFIEPLIIKGAGKKILYAPTWEAHFAEMDYCSLGHYGRDIAKEIIANPNYIFIYKPHPLIGTQKKPIKKIHNEIVKLIEKSENAFYLKDSNIINLFDCIDFAFFDNSSVMIDYLFFQKPGAYIEIREDIESKNLQKAYYKYNEQQDINITSFIDNWIVNDKKKQTRLETKEYYLGNFGVGESTNEFIDTIGSFIEQRNRKLKN